MTRRDRISAGVGAIIVGIVVYLILQNGETGMVSTGAGTATFDASPAAPEPSAPTAGGASASSEPATAARREETVESGAEDAGEAPDRLALAPAAETQVETAPDEPSPEPTTAAGGASDNGATDEAEAPAGDPPVFDVVRIEPDGTGLVAGRASPGAEVDVVVDGEVIARTKADEDGAFVAFVAVERKSDASGEPTGDEAGEAAPVGDQTQASRTLILRARPGEAGPAAVSSPVFVIGGLAEDAAPVIVQPEAETVRLIQPPARPATERVTLDAISYDESGRVVFAGRGRAEGAVRLYLDGAPIAEAPLSDDGSWRTRAADPIAAGVYSLRIDQVAATGAVLSRIETPFKRENIAEGAPGDGMVIVQRGDSLWRLAENAYGAGPRYTLIFAANDDQIRDPDLIYPGQIFAVPEAARP